MLKKVLVGTWDALVRWSVKVWMTAKPYVLMLVLGLVMGTALGFGQLAIAWSGN